jgi:hypothetical protein
VRTTRLRITLRDVEPVVRRIVDVPAAVTLPELHRLLQVTLGWTDSHLHRFESGAGTWGPPGEFDERQHDEAGARLKDLGAAFGYLYDFGDGWEHDVEVLGAGDAEPGCRYGEGACPPEDCGGPGGNAHLLAVLADPTHDEHAHLREWAGELPEFDQAATDLLVRQTVGTVPASVRLVLELAAGGVRLTPGGRLPRAFVRKVQEQRPGWYPFDGRPASREEDLVPLLVLHDELRRVGLLRLSRGVVTPTRAASDELDTVRRLRSCLDDDPFGAVLADLAVALVAAEGPLSTPAIAERVHPLVGPGWSSSAGPVTVDDVHRTLGTLGALLEALDLVERDSGCVWRAGSGARTLLLRATAPAHHRTAGGGGSARR